MSERPIQLALNYFYQLTPFGLLRRIDRPGERRAAGMVLLSTGMAIMAIWGIAAIALYQARNLSINEHKDDLERMARVVEEQTRNELSKIQLFLTLVDSHYREHPNLDPRNDPELEQFIQQLRSISNGGVDIRLVTTKGDIYTTSGEGTVPLANVADRDYVKAQKNPETRGFYIGRPILSRITGHWTLPISFPLADSPGDILLLSAAIDSLSLERLYDAGRPRPHGSIALLHRDGTILVHAPIDQRLIGLSVADSKQWQILKAHPRDGVRLDQSLVDGTPKLAAYVALDDFPLVVVVTASLEDILAQWQKFLGVVLKIGVLLTAVVLLLAHHLILRVGELSVTRNELEKMAQTDPLTGLFNRRHFWIRGAAEIARISRYARPLSALAIDLDHFKQINDRYGHSAGDEALRWFAKTLGGSLRQADIAARLGGEEFSVLLPETTLDNAERLAERIRLALAATPVTAGDETFSITASIGVAGTGDTKTTLESLLARADQALYQAKNGGRNRTVVAANERLAEVQDVG